jgi:hypothetical protein
MTDVLKEMVQRFKGTEDLPDKFVEEINKIDQATAEESLPEAMREKGADLTKESDADTIDVRRMINEMEMPDRIKTAMFGNSVCRAILITDPSKMIQLMVLKNPKLGASEVEDFVKNPNMGEAVLRAIGDSRDFTKGYSVKYYLVTNPRTPGDVALKWMRFLNINDLKKISKSKNVPQLVSVTAKKRVADMDKKG